MSTKKRVKRRPAKTSAGDEGVLDARALQRRVRRLESMLAQERARHLRRIELIRRAANRRLAAMMQEIATLRHHEARAEALERMLAAYAPAPEAKDGGDGEDSRLPG
jgi:hypothetical protein